MLQIQLYRRDYGPVLVHHYSDGYRKSAAPVGLALAAIRSVEGAYINGLGGAHRTVARCILTIIDESSGCSLDFSW